MANILTPIELQSLLTDIGGRRALAMALRNREDGPGQMVSDRYVPNLRPVGGALARGLFGDPLDALRQEEQAGVQSYRDELAGATEGLIGADPNMDDREFARRFARGQSAGVSPDVLQQSMKRHRPLAMFDAILAQLDQGPAAGGRAPAVGGAPAAQPPAGGPQGAGGMQMPPMPAGRAGGPSVQPQPGQQAFAGAMAGGGSGTPLQNVSDGKLLTLGAMLPADDPAAKMIAAELQSRAIKMDQGGLMTRGGRPIGIVKDGVFIDTQGQAFDLTGGIEAKRAGDKAGAEATAKAPYEMVETVDSAGRRVTIPKDAFIRQQRGPQPAAAGGPRIKVNFEGTPDEIRAHVERALAEVGGVPAGGLGVGPDPIEQKQREADIEVDAAGKKKQREAQVTGGAQRYEEVTKAYQGAQDMKPIVAKMRALDSSGVMTGPPQEAWKAFANFANSAVPGLALDSKRLANSQTFDSEISKMVQGIAKNFPGAQSDRELQQLLNSLPSRMQSPAARKSLYDALESRIAKIDASYRSASDYYRQRGDMIGWEPPAEQQAPTVLRFDAQGNPVR